MSLNYPQTGLPVRSIKGESEAEVIAFVCKPQAVCISGVGHRTALGTGGTSIDLFHKSTCSGECGICIEARMFICFYFYFLVKSI